MIACLIYEFELITINNNDQTKERGQVFSDTNHVILRHHSELMCV